MAAARRPGRDRSSSSGVLDEDRALEPLQRRPGLDPELLDEQAARLAIGLERRRLAAGAVEREHQLAADPLAQRVRGDERLELGDERAVAAEGEVGVDPLLEQREPELLEPRRLDGGERLEGELRERRAAPERERLVQPRSGSLEVARGLRVPSGSRAAARSG